MSNSSRHICLALAITALNASASSAAFSPTSQAILRRIGEVKSSTNENKLRMVAMSPEPEDLEGFDKPTKIVEAQQDQLSQKLSKYSQSIPFLERPKFLTGELAGDVGFDPLGFAKNRELLFEYREAEMKHSRLAMLAAAGWPISELLDARISNYFGLEAAVDSHDRAPSMFNGGMDKISPVWWGFCLGMTAAIDLYGVQRARAAGIDGDYKPGDLGFDPLGLYPDDPEEQKKMQLTEIKHGRLSMIAVLGFSVQEAITQEGVVDETPLFFKPITETLPPVIDSVLN